MQKKNYFLKLIIPFFSIPRQPQSKFSLRYDKLLVDKQVFAFNEISGCVELLNNSAPGQEETAEPAPSSPTTPHRFIETLLKGSFTNRELLKNFYQTLDINYHWHICKVYQNLSHSCVKKSTLFYFFNYSLNLYFFNFG